jgi:hypothetical protein
LLLDLLFLPITITATRANVEPQLYEPILRRPIELLVSNNLPIDAATYLGNDAADKTTAVSLPLVV